MKYFGTDGIRGVPGKTLSERLIKKIAIGIVRYFNANKSLKKQIVVGNDSRISSSYILCVLNTVLLKNGINVEDVGICTSPALAFLTKKFAYPLGIMLSASHNPSEYNGIKFFNSAGEKVDDIFEKRFESLMDKKSTLKNKDFAIYSRNENLLDSYYNYLKSFIKINPNVIFDCSYGGASKIIKKILPNCAKINTKFNGKNINFNAGCTNPEQLILACREQNKMGFAFDGDADRILVVDEQGNCYNGDAILYLFSKFYLNKNDFLVGTIYTNTGLKMAVKKKQISLIQVGVGDKLVLKQMKECNSNLGGEKSGHIIIKPYTHTGDGILCALLILNIINLSGQKINELLSDYKPYFQFETSLDISSYSSKKVNDVLSSIDLMGANVIIRPSGTEPILRIMIEHKNENIAKNLLKTIKNLLKE